MLAAVTLFILPAKTEQGQRTTLLNWDSALELPWGLIFLFGGGLSLANAFEVTQVGTYLGSQAVWVSGVPQWVMITLVVSSVIFLTELTSNAATTATLVPILAAVAKGLGIDPLGLVIPTGLAASCAFMLPVATPPNAIVFGTGDIRMIDMCKAGFYLNLCCIVVISLYTCWVILPMLR
jgi:sodium-dependent dicarboxylate transporter 2/3/5